MAEIHSEQCKSVFSEPMEDISHHKKKKLTGATPNDITITKDDIIKAIREIANGWNT